MILKDRRSRRKRACPLDRNEVPHPIRFAERTYRFTLYRSAHFVNSSDYVQQAIGQRRAEGYCAIILVSTIIWILTLLQALLRKADYPMCNMIITSIIDQIMSIVFSEGATKVSETFEQNKNEKHCKRVSKDFWRVSSPMSITMT